MWTSKFLGNTARLLLLVALQTTHLQAETRAPRKIILVAGETAKVDVVGHHDYLAGCQCLDVLLRQNDGVDTVCINDGWPEDENVFDGASAVVFYTDGGGKQAFLNSPERIAKIQSLADAGVGLVMIHQAVDFPAEFAEQATGWLGGIYVRSRAKIDYRIWVDAQG